MTTDNRTLAVDVLAVVKDDAMFAGRRRLQTIPEHAGDAQALSALAFEAIAELIAADMEYDEAKAEQDDNAKFDQTGMYVPRAVYERMEAAIARRTAALARVKGESA